DRGARLAAADRDSSSLVLGSTRHRSLPLAPTASLVRPSSTLTSVHAAGSALDLPRGWRMGSSEPTIVYDLKDAVACVRLNRPQKLNAFTFDMMDALRAAREEGAADERAVAVVVTGTGRAFSAGLDVGDLVRSTENFPPTSAGSPHADAGEGAASFLEGVPRASHARKGSRHDRDAFGDHRL